MINKSIDFGNGIVHYYINKTYDPTQKCILFTHGLTSDNSMFEKQIEFFTEDFNIITWDVPLHGRSVPYANFSYHDCACIIKGILDKEDIKKIILVGMSMGGYTSQMFGHLYPDMTEGFIAIDTTPFGLSYYSKSDIFWLKHAAPLAKYFPYNTLKNSMAKSVSTTMYSKQKMLDMLSHSSKVQIIEQLDAAYSRFIAENQNLILNFPTIILLGDSDKTGKVAAYCDEWAKNIGAPLYIIENAAHFSNGDNPTQVNNIIYDFINSL